MSTRKRLLLDADGMILTAALAAQKPIEWDDEVFTIHADLETASQYLHGQITGMTEALDVKGFILCFSDPTRKYFRHEVYPDYKSSRSGGIPPLASKALLELAMKDYPHRMIPGLEADDVMGILATDPFLSDQVIVSVDKDMKQIPGLHADPTKLDEGIFEVEDVDADRFLWEQVLTGDTVDGYPGLKGVGPVAAKRILDKAEENEMIYEEAAWEAYHKRECSREFFEQMVNVARILKYKDLDDNGNVKLWSYNG